MEEIQSLIHMGGYAAFVWPAYGATALIMAGLYFVTRRNLKRLRTLRDALEAQEKGADA